MKRSLVVAAALALLVACYSPGEPRVDRPWANVERERISNATPDQDKWQSVVVKLGDDHDKLEGIGGDHGKDFRAVAKLGAGQWKLAARTEVRGGTVVLEGAGPEKTRLLIDTEDVVGLAIRGGRLELRDMTVAGQSGGGIVVEKGDVVVEDVDFAGATFGLDLIRSNATISSCVFAGCVTGVAIDGGRARIAGCAFVAGWDGIRGRGTLELVGCAFLPLKNKAIEGRLVAGSSIEGSLFASGDPGWTGAPNVTGCLVPPDLLDERVPRELNRPIYFAEQFPDSLPDGFPRGFRGAAVTYAIERARARGSPDAPAKVDDALLAQARYYAKLARENARTSRSVAVSQARAALEFASLVRDKEARDEVKDLAPLVR